MAFKIALASGKGGVGKTTTAVNLSAALAERGQRVLVVDLDPQSHASLSLGVPRRELAPSVADVLRTGLPLAEAIRKTEVENLDLVTASADLATLDLDLPSAGREHTLVRPLASVEDDYDYIFLDSPATLNLLTRIALVAADGHLVPVTPHFLVLDGLENFLGLVKRTLYRLQAGSELVGILLTQIDGRTKNSRINAEAIRREYGKEVFAMEIRTNIRLAEAPEAGQTIFQYDPKATGAHGYRLAAEELLLRRQRPGTPQEQDEEPAEATAEPAGAPAPPATSPEAPPAPPQETGAPAPHQVPASEAPTSEPARPDLAEERPAVVHRPPLQPWSPSRWPRPLESAEPTPLGRVARPLRTFGSRR